MTVSKKLIKLEKLLKKSEELSTKLVELNNDEDENEYSSSTINRKRKLKSDIKIINKLYDKIYKITKLKPIEIVLRKHYKKWDENLEFLNKLYPLGYYVDVFFEKEDDKNYFNRFKSSIKFL